VRTGFSDVGTRSGLGLPSAPRFGPHGFLTRSHAWLRRSSLDRALAGGADPQASHALGCRARQLTSESKRRRLADAVRRLRNDAMRPPFRGWSSAVPINTDALIAADPILNVIEADLREGVVYCQGVVALERLLSDGGSSLYVHPGPSTLKSELADILDALEGRG
jgi:hypothetical protein